MCVSSHVRVCACRNGALLIDRSNPKPFVVIPDKDQGAFGKWRVAPVSSASTAIDTHQVSSLYPLDSERLLCFTGRACEDDPAASISTRTTFDFVLYDQEVTHRGAEQGEDGGEDSGCILEGKRLDMRAECCVPQELWWVRKVGLGWAWDGIAAVSVIERTRVEQEKQQEQSVREVTKIRWESRGSFMSEVDAEEGIKTMGGLSSSELIDFTAPVVLIRRIKTHQGEGGRQESGIREQGSLRVGGGSDAGRREGGGACGVLFENGGAVLGSVGLDGKGGNLSACKEAEAGNDVESTDTETAMDAAVVERPNHWKGEDQSVQDRSAGPQNSCTSDGKGATARQGRNAYRIRDAIAENGKHIDVVTSGQKLASLQR